MIRDVWASNLEIEMEAIRCLVPMFPYISMDTEFPGVVARPLGNFRNQSEFVYQTLRCNVDLLKLIQLGITLSDSNGNLPNGNCTWQFNFKFSLEDDTYAQDSIELLTHSGLNFGKHSQQGIDAHDFGELVMTSGLVLMPNVYWTTFHSGYDFGYFLKLLTRRPLPPDESEFISLLRVFFPSFYDIKFMMRACKTLKGGLQDIADDLGLERIGIQHQAGSDSLLTCQAFFKMRHLFFDENIDDSKYECVLYGLESGAITFDGKPVISAPINFSDTQSIHNSNANNNSSSAVLYGTTS